MCKSVRLVCSRITQMHNGGASAPPFPFPLSGSSPPLGGGRGGVFYQPDPAQPVRFPVPPTAAADTARKRPASHEVASASAKPGPSTKEAK